MSSASWADDQPDDEVSNAPENEEALMADEQISLTEPDADDVKPVLTAEADEVALLQEEEDQEISETDRERAILLAEKEQGNVVGEVNIGRPKNPELAAQFDRDPAAYIREREELARKMQAKSHFPEDREYVRSEGLDETGAYAPTKRLEFGRPFKQISFRAGTDGATPAPLVTRGAASRAPTVEEDEAAKAAEAAKARREAAEAENRERADEAVAATAMEEATYVDP